MSLRLTAFTDRQIDLRTFYFRIRYSELDISEENMWRHKQMKVISSCLLWNYFLPNLIDFIFALKRARVALDKAFIDNLGQEAESIQQQLLRVSKSDWCLICGLKFPNETIIRAHFLNIHQKGNFSCQILGCTYIASTNGDLRMHCLLFHAGELASLSSLPVNKRCKYFNVYLFIICFIIYSL